MPIVNLPSLDARLLILSQPIGLAGFLLAQLEDHNVDVQLPYSESMKFCQ